MPSFIQSKRFWGSVVSVVAVLFSEQFGIELTDEIKAAMVTAIIGFLTVGDSIRPVGPLLK